MINPDPRPHHAPNEVPATNPDEILPDQGDTDYPGSVPDETPAPLQPDAMIG